MSISAHCFDVKKSDAKDLAEHIYQFRPTEEFLSFDQLQMVASGEDLDSAEDLGWANCWVPSGFLMYVSWWVSVSDILLEFRNPERSPQLAERRKESLKLLAEVLSLYPKALKETGGADNPLQNELLRRYFRYTQFLSSIARDVLPQTSQESIDALQQLA